MLKLALSAALIFGLSHSVSAQEDEPAPELIELEWLEASVGVWDAEIEVWPAGPEGSSVKFSGVETNRAYGDYWIVSDFDSEFGGQTIRVHSIVGYDLDQEQLVGRIVDHGPYAANMTGEYDSESKTVRWMTEAKDPEGNPIVQQTVVAQKGADERLLVLSVPGENEDEFIRFMQIRFVKRD